MNIVSLNSLIELGYGGRSSVGVVQGSDPIADSNGILCVVSFSTAVVTFIVLPFRET